MTVLWHSDSAFCSYCTLVDDAKLQVSREFCPHHVSHYLGMDVHDTDDIKRSIKLCPGMIVTVEPGMASTC